MEHDSPLCTRYVILSTILLLFAVTSNAQPIDYDDVANLLPTEPQTTNDTLAAIVQDPVVQDAVQETVGDGSLEGLVVKKKVLIIPATEPTKVVSQREQVLVVPATNLEDVKKNITESATEETDQDDLALTDAQFFTQDGEKGSYEIEHPEDYQSHYPSPTISVPIIAFLDPAKISDDKIDVPIAAALSEADISRSRLDLLENRDEIQQNVQDYIDGSSLSVDPDYWRLTSPPSQTSLLYEPATMENQYASVVPPETSLPVAGPRIDIITPLFWTSDANVDYPKDPRDLDTAPHIVFRPLFRFRQEEQRRSWRRGADNDYRRSSYQRYNPYNPYPRRDYRYRPRYSGDYY